MKFKIDTGVDISVISHSTDNNLHVRPVKGIFRNSGGTLSCDGKFKTFTTNNGNSYLFDVYVIKDLDMESLLLIDFAQSMEIVIKVKEVENIFDQGGCIRK